MSKQQTKGFTIIEVVLVLAIAGLIFLMVFLALPALQRNQRDQQRRGDLGRLIAATQSYQSNSSGRLPFTYTGDYVAAGDYTTTLANLTTYLDTFQDPSTNANYRTLAAEPGATTAIGSIAIRKNWDCTLSTPQTVAGKISFYIKTENGTSYCQVK